MDDKPKTPDNESLEGETLGTSSASELVDAPVASQTESEFESQDQPPVQKETPAKRENIFKRLAHSRNLYLVIYVVLFLAASAVVFAAIKWGNNPSQKTPKTGSSLTSSDLAQLSGSTTVVGDAKQTLDIQSAAVFEGQVLMRGDLNVAGSLKVGSSLSLPSITVGNGSFSQLQVNDTLSVSGNGTVQGQLSVQKNLSVAGSGSFGSLSASQLSVSSLQFTGDLAIAKHITPTGGVPGKTNGSALGSGGSASVGGSDTAGTVTINTGGSPPAGCFVTVNFAQKFNTTPHVVISPSNSSAASLDYYTNRTNTSFSLCTVSAPAATTTYLFDYIAFD
ncbi:hypothetical protein HY857_02695 [Candidatus Saccharibacteria bacterium]|nr:hypothetical protein [Candidatus Saccharibacteria bacterium]